MIGHVLSHRVNLLSRKIRKDTNFVITVALNIQFLLAYKCKEKRKKIVKLYNYLKLVFKSLQERINLEQDENLKSWFWAIQFCFEQKTKNFWQKHQAFHTLPSTLDKMFSGSETLANYSSLFWSFKPNTTDTALLSTAQALIGKDVKMSLWKRSSAYSCPVTVTFYWGPLLWKSYNYKAILVPKRWMAIIPMVDRTSALYFRGSRKLPK